MPTLGLFEFCPDEVGNKNKEKTYKVKRKKLPLFLVRVHKMKNEWSQ